MLAIRVAVLLILLTAGSLASGFFLLRRLRWRPLELLCGSVGLSLILIYLAALSIYIFGLPPRLHLAIGAVNLMLLVSGWRELSVLLRSAAVRRPLMVFGFLLIWALVALSLVRHYGGAGWSGDWLEHFQRTLVFVHRLPPATVITPGYALPARPPLMNAVAAHFLAQVGDDFELFSITFLVLNLWVVLACALLLGALSRRGGGGVWVLGALLACNPLLNQNLTYSWTKLLAAFYALLGFWFYVAGWRRGDRNRTVAAFIALAAGILVHYSVAPYALVVGLHYVGRRLWRAPRRWSEVLLSALPATALLWSWFGFSITQFGVKGTLTSNTTVIASRQLSQAGESNLSKIALNLFDTVVPHPLRSDLQLGYIDQASAVGYLRDYLFLCWQTNLILAMGTIGGLAVVFLLVRVVLDPPSSSWRRRQRRFWLGLASLSGLLGVLVVGERQPEGVAHVTLQPLVLLGVALLAGRFATLPSVLRWLVVGGCLVDFGFGVLLHHHIQNAENRGPQSPDFFRPVVEISPGGHRYLLTVRSDLTQAASANWLMKHRCALVYDLAQRLDDPEPAVLAPAAAGPPLRRLARSLELEDREQWGGWFGRHAGRVVFLGDRLAPWSWPLRLVWLGLFGVALSVLLRAALG